MFLPLTEEYVANKFFQNCGKPHYNRAQRTYQGSCPICREGKSWLRKRRCYYIVEKNVVCCHNCGWYSNPYNWIIKVTGSTYIDIRKELDEEAPATFNDYKKDVKQEINHESLPSDCVNLSDNSQTDYYGHNTIVRQALNLIKTRRLDSAINRPKAFYLSLTDKIHSNRLVIPFLDSSNKIIFYQTRTIAEDDTRPKYLSKVNSEKSLYGINNISADLDHIFITEGPIDAMFINNGVAVAGINESRTKSFTDTQQLQLNQFLTHKKIWVLDNQYVDITSRKKTKLLIDAGETVFLWPEHLKKYKDLNDYCIDKQRDSMDTNIILDNSFNNLKAKLLLGNY